MIEEEFRSVKGYEGLYEVSNLGRVRSLKNGKERILSGRNNGTGYLQVGLWKDGKVKFYYVHRLVAEAFIPNPDNLPEVNHINECKQSNVATNLEWCDRRYNNDYGTRTERISRLVYQYTKSGEFVRSYPSTNEASRQTGINQGGISDCCNGNRNHTGGYRWSYSPLTNALF